tara:strand:- start:1534 stop:1992 length:459 start_codon:yes stop_codon:yes gene_type:complete
MMGLKIVDGEIAGASYTEQLDMQVHDNFFSKYNASSYELVDGELVLKENADELEAERLEAEAALRLAQELVEAKALKIAEIDAKTAADIIEIVGDATSQRNLLAEYLNAKGTDGVVTTYELQWKEVEELRASGNEREALVADALDIEEVELI